MEAKLCLNWSISGYLFYLQRRRKRLMKGRPGLSLTEASRIIGNEWRKLTPTQQRVYEGKSRENKVGKMQAENFFRTTMQQSYKNMIDANKENIVEKENNVDMNNDQIIKVLEHSREVDKKIKHIKRRKRKSSRSIGEKIKKSKRQSSPYLFYLKEEKDTIKRDHPDTNYNETVSTMGKEWSKLDMNEVIPEKDKENYSKERKAFEQYLPTPNILP